MDVTLSSWQSSTTLIGLSVAIGIGLTTNTVTKIVLAFQAGGFSFAIKIAPGLLLMLAAVWAGFIAMP